MKILAITYRLEFKHKHEHEYDILCAVRWMCQRVCSQYLDGIHNSFSGFRFVYLFLIILKNKIAISLLIVKSQKKS